MTIFTYSQLIKCIYSAFALRAVGGDQSQGAAQNANNNGLAGVNAAVGVQAEVGGSA
ncbi:MAG TPA: hypothetical protein VJ729_06120 [Nitrososphaeraceae archaeon]|jgi:hypothetical protein|nr:hypothetical protein [Nitrososphaeraceae archaeon]